MKIKILGTRGEIKESARYHSKKSGVLLDNKILLDIGEKDFLKYNPEYILITHLHPDHAYFVRHKEIPKTSSFIYAPEKYLNVNIKITKKHFKIENYKITAIPTTHSIKVKSNAYLIEYKNKRLLYTGDMIWIEKKYHYLLKYLDLVITEASFKKKGGIVRQSNPAYAKASAGSPVTHPRDKFLGILSTENKKTGEVFGHTGIPNLVRLFKKFTNKILFMHFGAWFYKDIKDSKKYFQKLAKENEIDIITGYDGLELEI